jgi:rubrerythrin
MPYFWRCPVCNTLHTFTDDDDDPICAACFNKEQAPELPMDPALD